MKMMLLLKIILKVTKALANIWVYYMIIAVVKNTNIRLLKIGIKFTKEGFIKVLIIRLKLANFLMKRRSIYTAIRIKLAWKVEMKFNKKATIKIALFLSKFIIVWSVLLRRFNQFMEWILKLWIYLQKKFHLIRILEFLSYFGRFSKKRMSSI